MHGSLRVRALHLRRYLVVRMAVFGAQHSAEIAHGLRVRLRLRRNVDGLVEECVDVIRLLMRHLLLLRNRRQLLLGQLLAVEQMIIGHVRVLVPFKILLKMVGHAAVEVGIVHENALVHDVHRLLPVVGVERWLSLTHRSDIVAVTFFVDLITLNCLLIALRIQIFCRFKLFLTSFVLRRGAVTHGSDLVEKVAGEVCARHDVAGHFAADHLPILFLCFSHQLCLLARRLLRVNILTAGQRRLFPNIVRRRLVKCLLVERLSLIVWRLLLPERHHSFGAVLTLFLLVVLFESFGISLIAIVFFEGFLNQFVGLKGAL